MKGGKCKLILVKKVYLCISNTKDPN